MESNKTDGRERRRDLRRHTDVLVNKFIDGMPYLARFTELSVVGGLLERILEPEVERELYPLELNVPTALGGGRLWLWARTVWRDGSKLAVRFVGLDPVDRGVLRRFVDHCE